MSVGEVRGTGGLDLCELRGRERAVREEGSEERVQGKH